MCVYAVLTIGLITYVGECNRSVITSSQMSLVHIQWLKQLKSTTIETISGTKMKMYVLEKEFLGNCFVCFSEKELWEDTAVLRELHLYQRDVSCR